MYQLRLKINLNGNLSLASCDISDERFINDFHSGRKPRKKKKEELDANYANRKGELNQN